ncbi:hypothetical protein SUGI_0545830 [Cryptomeria japonica]|nr:hypothetical protein SUGI_0545830 [Cryptomeria japonica]
MGIFSGCESWRPSVSLGKNEGFIVLDNSTSREQENEFLANITNRFQVISNGIYNSIEHRAVTSTERDRISIAMLCSPSGETEMGPAPELIDELHPCQYRKFIRQGYMQHYFSSRFDGKGSLEFAKIKS